MSSKHGNKKASRVLGKEVYVFDSQKEARRFDQLYLLAKAKKIQDLIIQPEFLLMDTQSHNGITYRKVKYIADFKYTKNGKTIVEDVKSDHTRKLATYRVKVKWFLSIYGKDLTFLET